MLPARLDPATERRLEYLAGTPDAPKRIVCVSWSGWTGRWSGWTGRTGDPLPGCRAPGRAPHPNGRAPPAEVAPIHG